MTKSARHRILCIFMPPSLPPVPLRRLPSDLHRLAVQQGHLLPSHPQQSALPPLDALIKCLPSHHLATQTHLKTAAPIHAARRAAILAEQKRQPGLFSRLQRQLPQFIRPRYHPPATRPNGYYNLPEVARAPRPPRGVYLYGDVGCGKSLLMDMMFSSVPADIHALRLHFHFFMQSIHSKLHSFHSTPPRMRQFAHPLDEVVSQLNAPALLCFDELQVSDVADARLMYGVLRRLANNGTCVCFTSNRAPQHVNRSHLGTIEFQDFFKVLSACTVVQLDGPDYRAVLSKRDASTVCFEASDEIGLQEAWNDVTGVSWDDVVTATWDVGFGRKVTLPRVVPGCAIQIGNDFLQSAVGAADFRALAQRVDAIFLSDIVGPFGSNDRDISRRFITLIDVCYEARVRVYMRAKGGVDGIFDGGGTVDRAVVAENLQSEREEGGSLAEGQGTIYTGEDEGFAGKRAISRLREMGTRTFGKRDSMLGILHA